MDACSEWLAQDNLQEIFVLVHGSLSWIQQAFSLSKTLLNHFAGCQPRATLYNILYINNILPLHARFYKGEDEMHWGSQM